MSAHIPRFEPLEIPIEGTNLIEASAGTGKTYNIAALFARLIVLEKLPVESVLVVTFTKAATAELKTRLRTRLDDALQLFAAVQNAENAEAAVQTYCAKHHGGDAFLPALAERALQQSPVRQIILRLKAAISQFDNAAIYTIHGFCQRILRDYAFLCQTPFDVELADEDETRLLVPAQDFWRTHISNHPENAKLVFECGETPQTFLDKIKRNVGRLFLSFRRPEFDLAQTEARVLQTWEAVCSRLDELEAAFWNIFPNLKGNIYKEKTYREDVFAPLAQAVLRNALPKYDSSLAGYLLKLETEKLEAGLKKGCSADAAAVASLQRIVSFAEAVQAHESEKEKALIALQLDLLAHLNRAVQEAKKTQRERVFDDLLSDVYQALSDRNPHGKELAKIVANQWKVALIDEFQDTDPQQYEIFSRIFMQQGNPLFLVGDPKQAIYGFRGADIHAYLKAAEDAQHQYTLETNFRSHAKLINSISALFQLKNKPFVLDKIDHTDVKAVREESRLEPKRSAVKVRWLRQNGKDTVHGLRNLSAEMCADEIAADLNEAAAGRLKFKDKPLEAGQIAVLVRTHNEAELIAQKLKERGLRSVSISKQSVFASPEAAALSALLGFWQAPTQTAALRFVLGSALFDYTAEQLYALNQDENALLAWIDSAKQAMQQWQQKDFYSAMQAFSARHHLEPRLIAAQKERSLTNFHQLMELLAVEDAQSHSPSALHHWFQRQIADAQGNKKAESHHILRLESGENLIKIVTMHTSKGLQYPLVYCPFAWDTKKIAPNEWQTLHRGENQNELLAKAQLSDEDKRQLENEEMGERLRLLYVAMTRAEEQLIIYAAARNETAFNAFAYLLEGGKEADFQSVRQTIEAEKDKAGMLKKNWLHFLETAPKNTEIEFIERDTSYTRFTGNHAETPEFRAVSLPERKFKFLRHTSFSGLSRHIKTSDENIDEWQLDAAEAEIMPSEKRADTNGETDEKLSIHEFPRGTHAGLCLHEMLEKLDFRRPAAEQTALIGSISERYQFGEEWLPALCTMIDVCRTAPLIGTSSLADIPPQNRLPEMGFTLYMNDFRLCHLQKWFAQPHIGLPPSCIEAAQHLDFYDVEGFLNGFIDMVCQDSDGKVCVIDYKSNHLGDSSEAYTQAAMDQAMAEHHYYLQALIYAIAAARYFALRRRPLETVSVRYLFLRGMDGSSGGVWQWDIHTRDLAAWLNAEKSE